VPASPGGGVPEFTDGFDLGRLDPARWIPGYLAHWSSRERAAARYRVDGGRLALEIAPDQGPWNPADDGATRVSSIQTGMFAGPVGSSIGQHRFRPVSSSGRPSRRPDSTPRCLAGSRPA